MVHMSFFISFHFSSFHIPFHIWYFQYQNAWTATFKVSEVSVRIQIIKFSSLSLTHQLSISWTSKNNFNTNQKSVHSQPFGQTPLLAGRFRPKACRSSQSFIGFKTKLGFEIQDFSDQFENDWNNIWDKKPYQKIENDDFSTSSSYHNSTI